MAHPRQSLLACSNCAGQAEVYSRRVAHSLFGASARAGPPGPGVVAISLVSLRSPFLSLPFPTPRPARSGKLIEQRSRIEVWLMSRAPFVLFAVLLAPTAARAGLHYSGETYAD